MACFYPLTGWKGEILASGKRKIVFSPAEAEPSLVPFPFQLPCGQCVGCRLERSRQWAIRCVLESKLYADNCVVTLTYRDDELPVGGSLNLRDIQGYMKRLRQRLVRSGRDLIKNPVRFFQCGEYGEDNLRPHHHAVLFNYDYEDKKLWKTSGGVRLFRSDQLDKDWGKGFALIGDVTMESAAYVARYVMKKVNGVQAVTHYRGLKPEYVTMSRRPGIGSGWLSKFSGEVAVSDMVESGGMKMRPPRFFDSFLEKFTPFLFQDIKSARLEKAVAAAADNTYERLMAKEECTLAALKLRTRRMEAVS